MTIPGLTQGAFDTTKDVLNMLHEYYKERGSFSDREAGYRYKSALRQMRQDADLVEREKA